MPETSTNFLNAKQHRIFQGERGGFFVKKDGKKIYRPTAAFRKAGAEGAVSKLGPMNRLTVPSPIRRAVRKNAGVARKVKRTPSPNQGALLRRMFRTPKKAIRRIEAMIVSPGGTVYKSKRSMAARKRR